MKPVCKLLILLFVLHASGCQTGSSSDLFSEGTSPEESSVYYNDEEAWRFVALPDTQCYSERFPDVLAAQVEWIIASVKTLDIRFVVHLGDIVNNPLHEQWHVAQEYLSRLSGHVPFMLIPGNHDFEKMCFTAERRSLMDEYFSFSDFGDESTLGEMYQDSIWNSYHYFSGSQTDWLVLGLEYGPRDEVLDWANDILNENSDHNAILVTHGYLYGDNTRYDRSSNTDQMWSPYDCQFIDGGINDGAEIWDKVISKHSNVRFVLCGHSIGDGAARLSGKTPYGNTVHQLLSNYQTGSVCPEQGEDGRGFLRILEFREDSNQVHVITYSPWLDEFLTDLENDFILEM